MLYRVIDTYEHLGWQSLHFHGEHSNVALDIDLGTMTKAERQPAIEILKRAIKVLQDDK